MSDERDYLTHRHSGLFPGLIVAGIGLLFLLNNLGIIYARQWWMYWPVILIAIGICKLVDSPYANEKAGGAIMLAVGGVFLANNLGFLPWRIWELWPVILIAAGLWMLVDRSGGSGLIAGVRIKTDRTNRIDGVAIFGGFKRKIVTDDFRSAHYHAVFGGGEIDLRRAQIQGDAAEIEVHAVFGGFEIRVPTNWIVINRVVGIFGGSGDQTVQPDPNAPGVKQLIIRGSTIFGGVGIKN